MSDTASKPFREGAQKLTRLRIDGVDVNPNEVTIEAAADIASSASYFEIEIGCAALHHELQQAGVKIPLSELAAFVQKDLAEHPQEALSGYLGIVRGIRYVGLPKRRWRLFTKSEPAAMLKWSIGRAGRVVSSDERLVICGVANRIGG